MVLSRLTLMAVLSAFAATVLMTGCMQQTDDPAGEPVPPLNGDDGTPPSNQNGGTNNGGASGGDPPDGSGGDPDPPPPTVAANAGPDQTVTDGVLVTLSGSGQDSTGATLSYSWSQTAGPVVVLNGRNTSTATFTSPDRSATFAFRLEVVSASGSSVDDMTVTVQAAPILFVVNAGGSIARFRADAALNGNAAPAGLVSGPNARLNGPTSIAPDRIGGILVANSFGQRISGFLNALTITGDITPERYVGGPASLLAQPEGLAYDDATDELYVSNFDSFPGTVNVYDEVSTPSFFGDVAPARRIQSTAIQNSRDVELTTSGELYVVNAGGQNVTVFANASALDGAVGPSRTINSSAFRDYGPLLDACLDAQGRLLVVASGGDRVLVFEDAAGIEGEVVPDRVLIVPGAGTLAGVVVDAAGTGYVTDSAMNSLYIYSGMAGLDGSVAPDRTVSGDATGLSVPGHMTLVPR